MRRPRKRPVVSFEKAAMSALEKIPGVEKELKRMVRLKARWLEVVGPHLITQVAFLRLKGDIAVLGVLDHVYATELRYMEPLIVEKINAVLGPRKVKRIQLKVIPRLPEEASMEAGDPPPDPFAPPPPDPAPLSPESRRKLEESLASIEDPVLRAQLERILLKSLRRYGP